MIEFQSGDLLKADVEALVNTVNTVGVMGKGIALQFRQAFPRNYEAYRRASSQGEVQPGRVFIFRTGELANPRFIINFPTKRHWRHKARLEDIRAGLVDLVNVVRREGIRSLAVPPLGCGSGGLRWAEVKPLIETALGPLTSVRVLAFEPSGTPAPEEMKIATARPRMTPTRAALLGVLQSYALPGYRASMLEVQKLAYFLQVAGEPLNLRFARGKYGPYSETLHHVFQRIEGHFVRGYGDRSRDASIRLLTDSLDEAWEVLRGHPGTVKRLERVSSLIEGFETPYGMELLSTIHWLAHERPGEAMTLVQAAQGVEEWSERKRSTFLPNHIEVAWSRLREGAWI